MAHVREGNLVGTGRRFGIVVSRFNEVITKELLEGALNHLRRSGVDESALEVVWVPGAFEIPIALQELALQKRFDALIALGCIIRGETSNYEHISQLATEGIARVMFEQQIPIGFGLLTVESHNQAIQRAGGKMGHKGREAAEAALEMANLIRELKRDDFQKVSEQIFSGARQEWIKNKFV